MDNPKDSTEAPKESKVTKDTKVPVSKSKTGNKRGRPSKKELKRPVGRPRNEHKHAMKEFLGSIIARPESAKVIDTVFRHALDDDSPKQTAAWTLVFDRIVPKGLVESEISSSSGRNEININISTIGAPTVNTDDPIEAEFTEVKSDSSE